MKSNYKPPVHKKLKPIDKLHNFMINLAFILLNILLILIMTVDFYGYNL